MREAVKRGLVGALLLGWMASAPSLAQDLASFEENLTEHRLENGLTFLIYERPGAPVASFYSHIDVGSAQEVSGITGDIGGCRREPGSGSWSASWIVSHFGR